MANYSPQDEYLFLLSKYFGFQTKIIFELIKYLGNIDLIFNLKEEELSKILRNNKIMSKLRQARYEMNEHNLDIHNSEEIFIPYTSPDFPKSLLNIEEPPLGIFYKGISPPQDVFKQTMIAIIGTRNCSPYGRYACKKICQALSKSYPQPTIVSGLAFGIDSLAHCTALDNDCPTIAILPSPINNIYPRHHNALAEKISHHPLSALISDYPHNASLQKINFIRRNRLIAGLAKAVLIIETQIRGGSMITAQQAFEYNRNVYALTGRIDDIKSQGCNYLINKNIASCIYDIKALLQDLELNLCGEIKNPLHEFLENKELDEKDKNIIAKIYNLIKKKKCINIDSITQSLKLEYQSINHYCLLLESHGVISINIFRECEII